MGFSFVLPCLAVSVGSYMLVRLRAFFLFHPVKTTKKIITGISNRDERRSLSLALAGTLGVGNIFGVASGIIIGGAGSVFWLLVSSVFAMIIKYSEVVLSQDNISSGRGGMHHVIRIVFSRVGKPLSILYASFCLALAFFMGGAMQSAAVVDVASSTLNLNPFFVMTAFLFLVVIGTLGKTDKIQNITEIIIPLTTIIYILMSFTAILLNISKLGSVCILVISDAFDFDSIAGGGVSFVFSRALAEGFARGVLSNEAGAGTSSLAHSLSSNRSPASAGVFGICEVFFDTVVLCMLTAFSILLSIENPAVYKTPMSLVTDAFSSSLGQWSGGVLIFSVIAFAYATVVCWFYYGRTSYEFLFGARLKGGFTLIFLFFVFVGALIDSRILLSVTDALLALMSVLTLMAVMKKAGRIVELTKNEDFLY